MRTRGWICSLAVISLANACSYPTIVDGRDGGRSDATPADVVERDTIAPMDVPSPEDVVDVVSSPDVADAPDTGVCVASGAEVCDGRDNDCDGMSDNVPAAMLQSNATHCGRCGNDCGALSCVGGACTAFPSNGSEGDFVAAMGVTTLTPGVHNYRTLTIPAGAIIRVSGDTGVLDLRATGAVSIAGEIDLSGGLGGSSLGMLATTPGCNVPTLPGGGARGGRGAAGRAAVALGYNGCEVGSNVGGNVIDGTMGNGGPGLRNGSMGACGGLGGANGGGNAGGRRGSGGGGGGGSSGGGGGSGVYATGMFMPATINGGAGGVISGVAASGGVASCVSGMCTAGGGGANTMLGATAGSAATVMMVAGGTYAASGGGGGGAMGATAFADALLLRLIPGSSGGAGGGGGDPCFAYGYSYGVGGGGGGGGGALRIASSVSIAIDTTAVISVRGGNGGNGAADVSSGGGGGGSGGAIDLRAPRLTVSATATIDASGGAGGTAPGVSSAMGGAGGPGRVHLSFDNVSTCPLAASAFAQSFADAMAPCAAHRPTMPGRIAVSRFSM